MIPDDTKTNVRVIFDLGPSTLFFLIQMMLVILKVTGYATWGWGWTLAPSVLIAAAFCVGVLVWFAKTVARYFSR